MGGRKEGIEGGIRERCREKEGGIWGGYIERGGLRERKSHHEFTIRWSAFN
jgi:hypothetical protein